MTITADDKALIEKYLEPDRPSGESEPLSAWVDAPMLEAVFSCGADDVRVVADRIRQGLLTIVAELDRDGNRQSVSTGIAIADRQIAFELKEALGLIADNKKLGAPQRLRAFELLRENK